MAKIALFKAGNTEKASGPKSSVSVPNDGRVTFLAIGAGTGRWRAHVAFAEVLNGVVLRRWDAFVTDAEPIATVLLDSNNGTLAGWLVEGEGVFAVGGFADAAEGASAISLQSLGIFNSSADGASLPSAYMEAGATYRDTSGTQYTYSAGAGWELGPIAKRTGNTVACFGNSIGSAWMPPQTNATADWNPSAAITLGAIIRRRYFDLREDSLTKIFTCTKAGTTGLIEPVWELCTIGGVVTDGTVEYACSVGLAANGFGFGYWAFAQMMAGQPLEEVFLMSYGGAKSARILEYRSKAEACDPDIMYYGPMFENDVWPGTAPVLTDIESAWSDFDAVVRDDIAKGRTVIVQTLLPNGRMDAASMFTSYTYGNGSKARQWVNAKIRGLADELGLILFDASSIYTDGNPANPVWPDNTETFTSKSGTGQGLKLTDNIHPDVVAGWRIALQFSQVLTAHFEPMALQSDAGDINRRSPNPSHYGTAGTLGTGATGQVSNSWRAYAYGTGGAATCSKVARTLVTWWNKLVYTVSNEDALSSAYSLSLSPWVIGDRVRLISEVRIEAGSTKFVAMNCVMKFTSGTYAQITSANHPGGLAQDIGQAILSDVTLVMKTPWVKIPAGTLGMDVENRFGVRGPGGLTANIGRSFAERVTTPVIQ